MKFPIAALSALLLSSGSANAFMVSAPTTGSTPSTKLHMSSSEKGGQQRIDTSEYITAAVAASQTFGPTSKEARVAWDIVEEMDASDNSAAFEGGINEEECLVALENEPDDCKEYYDKLEQLELLIQANGPSFEKMKSLAKEIQAVKMPTPPPSVGKDSPELRVAMETAKSATAEFGPKSAEAKLAWADVEDIASGIDASGALGGSLADECLVEALDACEALEEINRVIQLEKETVRQS